MELQDQETLVAAQALLARYADMIDRQEWDGLRSIFLPDATFDITDLGRGVLRDVEHIVRYMREDAIHPAAHLVANVCVLDDAAHDDHFDVRSRLLAVQSDGSVVVGTYEDTIARTPDGLRIATRAFHYVRRTPSHEVR